MMLIPNKLKSWLENLRFPILLLVTGALFAVNVIIPDALPLVDELLLALMTMLLARLKRRKPAQNDGSAPSPDQDQGQDQG